MISKVLTKLGVTNRKRMGVIFVGETQLLGLLGFDGGVIIGVRRYNTPGYVEILIEHPDMPFVKVGGELPIVDPRGPLNEGHAMTPRHIEGGR